jgi:hypothetical protein
MKTDVTDGVSVFRETYLLYMGMPMSDMHIHMRAIDQKIQKQRNCADGGVGGGRGRKGRHVSTTWFNYDPARPNGYGKGGMFELCDSCDGSLVV